MRWFTITTPLMILALLTLVRPGVAQDTTRVPERDTVVYEDDVAPAFGDEVFRGSLGVRAGFGMNPDQVMLGVQSQLGELYGPIRLAPSFDVGFGDDQTVFSLNADLLATIFTPPHSAARLYGAVGPILQISNVEDAGTNTDFGIALSAGIRLPFAGRNSYNLETRFGLGDVQEVRFLFGVLFGIRVDPDVPPSTTPAD